ncbi:hypothetical protein EYF80_016772 [Liparis tanakae]|uniref:Uncharacterized protein n=1 Tax=Liparis tanakae TaxID=230148 RepID=A0A4Z2I6S3_9TELE|nr:hypothetical protein EYF80_016772 [Liparis tanakae]
MSRIPKDGQQLRHHHHSTVTGLAVTTPMRIGPRQSYMDEVVTPVRQPLTLSPEDLSVLKDIGGEGGRDEGETSGVDSDDKGNVGVNLRTESKSDIGSRNSPPQQTDGWGEEEGSVVIQIELQWATQRRDYAVGSKVDSSFFSVVRGN